jgi:hypothetical protein
MQIRTHATDPRYIGVTFLRSAADYLEYTVACGIER